MSRQRVVVGVRVRPGATRLLAGDSRHVEAPLVAGGSARFEYDRVFWPGATQRDVYAELAAPLVERTLDGFNACLFAYGQTGSGKTHSVFGDACDDGVATRCVRELTSRVGAEHEARLACFEVYDERIRDLLAPRGEALRVREHPLSGPYVEGLEWTAVRGAEDAVALVARAAATRETAATASNARSSRSHAIVEMRVRRRIGDAVAFGRLTVVDLAGSERSGDALDLDRLRETSGINRSLLTLGKVISALSEPKRPSFVPYRESVLTWLLKENLGENSHTVMLATVSPERSSLDETLATLRYACRARLIINRVRVNEDAQSRTIRELQREIEQLKSKRNDIVEKLQEHKTYISPVKTAETKQVENELRQILSKLEQTERRKNELEDQNTMFIDAVKLKQVSCYKTDFYDRLQSILDDRSEPMRLGDDSAHDNNDVLDPVVHINEIKKVINALQNSCVTYMNTNAFKNDILPSLTIIDKECNKLCDVLVNIRQSK